MTPSRMYLMAALVAFAWMPGPGAGAAVAIPGAQAAGQYVWPVIGPVIRPFEQPQDPDSQGHRGIDIETPFGSPLRSAAAGVVAFSGVDRRGAVHLDRPSGRGSNHVLVALGVAGEPGASGRPGRGHRSHRPRAPQRAEDPPALRGPHRQHVHRSDDAARAGGRVHAHPARAP